MGRLSPRARVLLSAVTLLVALTAAPARASGEPPLTYTVSVPIATVGVRYATRLLVPGVRTSRYDYRELRPLPRGLRLSPSGLLTGVPDLGAGQWVLQVSMVPAHGQRGRAMVLRVDFAVEPGHSAAHGRPSGMLSFGLGQGFGLRKGFGFGGAAGDPVLPLSRAAVSPRPLLLSGRIGCWNMPRCNRNPTSFGSDAGGHALTQWTENGLADTGCTSPNGDHPQWVVNTTYGGRIGAYIDNEVDPFGRGTEQRQYLVDCVYAQGYGVILVGLYPSETSTYFLLPNDNGFAGGMLQWYPFCDGAYVTGYAPATSNPPPLEHLMASGYIVQKHYDNTCTVGVSRSQHRSEWNYAWHEVDNDGGDGIYNDLIAGY